MLRAVDWPAGPAPGSPGQGDLPPPPPAPGGPGSAAPKRVVSGAAHAAGSSPGSDLDGPARGGDAPGEGGAGGGSVALGGWTGAEAARPRGLGALLGRAARVARQLRSVGLALEDWAERFWQVRGATPRARTRSASHPGGVLGSHTPQPTPQHYHALLLVLHWKARTLQTLKNPVHMCGAASDSRLPARQDWGLEASMAALLVAAFTAVNALSLAHMALIAVGMAAPPAARRATWRLVALPLLGALLLAQFTVLIGLPPGVGELLGSGAWTGPCAGPLHAGGGCGGGGGPHAGGWDPRARAAVQARPAVPLGPAPKSRILRAAGACAAAHARACRATAAGVQSAALWVANPPTRGYHDE